MKFQTYIRGHYRTGLALLFLAAITLFCYAQVRHFDFINFDDNKYLLDNPRIPDGLTWDNLRWALTTRDMSNWHPMTWIAFLTISQCFGLNPGAFHLANLLFHLLNTLLLFGVLRLMTGGFYRSIFVAAMFSVHPLHVESVAWVSELKDGLSTFFWILAMFAYHRYVKTSGRKAYGLCLIFFALGLMSKPMLVTLPIILLLFDHWPYQRALSIRQWKKMIAEKIPFFVLIGLSSALTLWAQGSKEALIPLDKLPLGMRFSNAFIVYLKYILRLFWPENMAAFYPRMQAFTPLWLAVLCALLLLAVSAYFIKKSRRFPYLVTGWFWYVITLLPVIGIIQVGSQEMADRYTYVPYIGLFIMIAWGADEARQRWNIPAKALGVTAGSVILGMMSLTGMQVSRWKDSYTLWTHAAGVTRNNYVAHTQAAHALLTRTDRPPSARETEIAKDHLIQSLEIKENEWRAHNMLGQILAKEHRHEDSLKHFLRVRELTRDKFHEDPLWSEVDYNLGYLYYELRRFGDAQKHLTWSLEIDPNRGAAYYYLALIAYTRCDLEEAGASARRALEIHPDFQEAHNLIARIDALPGSTPEEKKDKCRMFDTLETVNRLNRSLKYSDALRKIQKFN